MIFMRCSSFCRVKPVFFVEGRLYPMNPGDIILSSPGELHRVEVLGDSVPYERIIVWIHPRLMKSLCDQSKTDLLQCFGATRKNHYHLIHPCGIEKTRIRNIFDALLMESWQEGFGQEALKQCLIAEFLIYLNRTYSMTSSKETEVSYHPKIDSIVQFINQHLQDDLSLDRLAGEFFISKYYLTRLFRQYTGQSLHQFVLQKRLALAKGLIIAGSEPFQACLEAGFVNYSHFSKVFKDRYGYSPSQLTEGSEKTASPSALQDSKVQAPDHKQETTSANS